MIGWIYLALLLSAVAYVLLRGGAHERLIVLTMLAVGVGTWVLTTGSDRGFEKLSLPLIANEAALLAVTLFVAYRSDRFWPLPVASFELAAFLSLLTPLFGRNLVSYGLGMAQGLWAYPQLAILVIATVRGQRKRGGGVPRQI